MHLVLISPFIYTYRIIMHIDVHLFVDIDTMAYFICIDGHILQFFFYWYQLFLFDEHFVNKSKIYICYLNNTND